MTDAEQAIMRSVGGASASTGIIVCPVCQLLALRYFYGSTGHLTAQCDTIGCLKL